jgi:glycosyltransferase involved in cell wall biosynthesis
VAARPHYPFGKTPKEYRRRLLRVKNDGSLRIIRTWVPQIASKGFTRRLMLFSSFCVSSLLALPLVGRIHVVWAANPNIFSVLSALFYRALKHSPIIQNVDDLWPEEIYDLDMLKSSRLRSLAEYISRFTYTQSSAITPISSAYTDVIVNKYKIDARKIHVVLAGVDLSSFANQKHRSRNQRRNREFKILYVGALSSTYNFDQVLEAAKLLYFNKRIKFIIQGGGELGSVLESKVKMMRLKNVIVNLKIVGRDEIPRILSEADVLLLPLSGLRSIEMGMSSKIYEYQASGKPIICVSNGQPRKYISKTGSGIVVKPGDSKGIAKAVLCLYNNKDLAKKLGEAGRRYVEGNLSCEKIGSRMENIFKLVSAQN